MGVLMKLKKIKWYDGKKQNLNQAVTSGVEFAFASPKDEQVSPFAYCKDYLQDSVQGFIHQKKKVIYGFSYNPKVHAELSLKKTKLLVTNSSDFEFSNKIRNCLNFLNQIEVDLKIKRTEATRCFNPPLQYIRPGVWLFEGSARWIKSPPMLSMYTLLIRLGFGVKLDTNYKDALNAILKGTEKAYQGHDFYRLKDAMQGINRIIAKGDRKIFGNKIEKNYPDSIPVSTMHNDCGIIGFAHESTKHYVPNWYKV